MIERIISSTGRCTQNRIIYWILLTLFSLPISYAQIVDAVEYFFDSDPGFGNGTPISITPATLLEVQITSFSPLGSGVHTLYVRARQNGVWGLPGLHRFWSEPTGPNTPAIIRLEFFFDNDPGIGNGIPLILTGTDSTTRTIIVPMNNLTPGFHWLWLRAMDSYGGISLPLPKPIWVEGVEYNRSSVNEVGIFFDIDLGPAHDRIVPLVAADSLTTTFIASLADLSAGYHKMGVRIKDSGGKWSLPYMKQILVLAPPDAPQFLVISYENNNATLNWSTTSVPMDSFRIYRNSTGHFNVPNSGTLIGTVNGSTTTFTDYNVTGEYYYRVTAYVIDD